MDIRKRIFTEGRSAPEIGKAKKITKRYHLFSREVNNCALNITFISVGGDTHR